MSTPVARICLNVDPELRGFMGYKPEHALRLVHSYEPIESEILSDTDICEQAFRLFNAPEDYLTPAEQAITATYRAAGNRSLSVGDVVFVQRGASLAVYSCDSVGWTPVEGEPRLVQEAPAN